MTNVSYEESKKFTDKLVWERTRLKSEPPPSRKGCKLLFPLEGPLWLPDFLRFWGDFGARGSGDSCMYGDCIYGHCSGTPNPYNVSEKYWRYTSNVYRSTSPICNAVPRWLLSFGEIETPQYTFNLYCSTPPICTAVRLPFVPAILLRKY